MTTNFSISIRESYADEIYANLAEHNINLMLDNKLLQNFSALKVKTDLSDWEYNNYGVFVDGYFRNLEVLSYDITPYSRSYVVSKDENGKSPEVYIFGGENQKTSNESMLFLLNLISSSIEGELYSAVSEFFKQKGLAHGFDSFFSYAKNNNKEIIVPSKSLSFTRQELESILESYRKLPEIPKLQILI